MKTEESVAFTFGSRYIENGLVFVLLPHARPKCMDSHGVGRWGFGGTARRLSLEFSVPDFRGLGAILTSRGGIRRQ